MLLHNKNAYEMRRLSLLIANTASLLPLHVYIVYWNSYAVWSSLEERGQPSES